MNEPTFRPPSPFPFARAIAVASIACASALGCASGDSSATSSDASRADASGDSSALANGDAATSDATLFPQDDGAPPAPPPSCTGGFSTSPIACDSDATLQWSCANATTCTYDCSGTLAQSGPIACTGTASVRVGTAGESCTIHATGPGGEAQAVANAACAGKPACSGSFTGCGANSTVSWNCTDATSCSYSCTGSITQSGTLPCTGSTAIAVGAAGETCTVTGTGAGGTSTGTFSATCLPPSCTGSFSGCGASTAIAWSCSAAASCTYDCTGSIVQSGSIACSGTAQIPVGAAGESCTISASGPGGQGTTTATTSCF